MTYVLSKLLWYLVAPGNFLLLLLAVGVFRRKILVFAVGALFAVALLPLGTWLARPLEDRYAPPPLPERVAGIVVLGGAIDGEFTALRGQPVLSDAAERLTAALVLARRYPEARVLFTGGEAALLATGHDEAAASVAFFDAMGLPRERLLIEDKSRNTWENALFTKEKAQPKPDETWLLVTSAWHMPRAMGCFRRVGWETVPWPVDYRTAPGTQRFNFALADQLALLTIIVREWIGLAAYWAMGRLG